MRVAWSTCISVEFSVSFISFRIYDHIPCADMACLVIIIIIVLRDCVDAYQAAVCAH